MIWDRDYMKRQADHNQVADDAESSSPASEPFNLFAGIQPEPLQSSPDSPVAKPAVEQAHASSSPFVAADSTSAGNAWIYVTIAIVALVIGLVLGSQFWN